MVGYVKNIAALFALTIIASTGCGLVDGSSPTGSLSNVERDAEAVATVVANSIGAELLILADDIEEVVSTEALPSQRPRPRLDRLKEALSLTDDQVDQITTIMEASRGLRDPIIQKVRDGSLTRQEARQQMRTIREDTKSQVEAVLTSDQLTAFEDLRFHHGRQFNRRPLSEILNLTDDQQAQVESVMKGIREQMLAIREQVEAEELTREDARGRIQEIRESEIEGLSAILDEGQLTKFQRILNHHRFGFGPKGFGRGPRGQFNRPGRR